MFTVKGKLDNGDALKGTIGGPDMGAALVAVVKNLPEGRSLSTVTLSKENPSGTLKVIRPRAKAAPAAPAAATKTAPATTPAQKKR